jgi:hypothetical protein
MAGMAWGGMNCQAGRFVYHQNILIFIDYGQRDWFSQRMAWQRRQLNRYPVVLAQSLAGLCSLPVYQNVTLPD